MYSEKSDFDEKAVVFQRLVDALRQMMGRDVISTATLALEVGGSGGILAGMVSGVGSRVICTDVVDVQVKYNGEFPRLLKEKFLRNGRELDLSKIEFHTVDAQKLIYGDSKFDLIFSLNAFEHIPDPIKAVKEIHRVLKPGGVFFASFDPVWTADSGSHFMHYTKEPWLHLLLEDEEYCDVMAKSGAMDWELQDYRFAMNRLPVTFYLEDMQDALGKLFSKHSLECWSGCVSPESTRHENIVRAGKKMGLSPEQLLVRGFQITAKK